MGPIIGIILGLHIGFLGPRYFVVVIYVEQDKQEKDRRKYLKNLSIKVEEFVCQTKKK